MNELLLLAELIFCVLSIYLLKKFFGLFGLYAYCIIATIASNIQILKCTTYSFYNSSVALGTVVFSSIFIADNIINEYYGVKSARDCVFLTTLSYLIFVALMYICIFYKCSGGEGASIEKIFGISFSLFVCSMCSYMLSQVIDVYFFALIKKILSSKFFWFRMNFSTIVSSFFDQTLFSVLLWKIFLHKDISWSGIFDTYVYFGYLFRIFIIVFVNTVFYFIRNR